jgi:hypothetical protein
VPAVNVKVVVLIVAGFIASLKVAVATESVQTPVAPLGGMTGVVTVGGVRSGLEPGLQHPGLKMSSRNAMNHVV